jgi:hypothetical protein
MVPDDTAWFRLSALPFRVIIDSSRSGGIPSARKGSDTFVGYFLLVFFVFQGIDIVSGHGKAPGFLRFGTPAIKGCLQNIFRGAFEVGGPCNILPVSR